MLSVNAANFLNLLQTLFNSEMEVGSTRGPLPPSMAGVNRTAAEVIRGCCDEMHLPITRASAQYIESSKTSEELSAAYLHVKRNMHHELSDRRFYAPEPRYCGHFFNAKLFGDVVFASFPSANDDIFEAGMCLALERGTACVMHLMRVMEAALRALAADLGVAEQKDWGAYLRNIDKEMQGRYQSAGARTADEQFYSEAALGFDQVRRAWRNPTLHIEKSYSPERAEEILQAVKSFICFIAIRISE